ncbi:MAG: DUF6807 family protein [Verrucomicrobiota bacterium]
MSTTFFRGLFLLAFTAVAALGTEVIVEDADGALGTTRSPVAAPVKLSRSERRAAVEGRLQLRELSPAGSSVKAAVPVQLFSAGTAGGSARISWLMPPGSPGKRTFKLQATRSGTGPEVIAKQDAASGQFDITDAGKPVLRYNYASIEPGDFITNVVPANRIYARARSDYIHPLFGLDGETLTKDWPKDHPHHRGIYWAWPEVDWRGQRGDLHALQKVFAKPIGKCIAISGSVFAQIEAENVWKCEDGESLVHERATIRAYHVTGDDRLLDLEFQFTALNDTVSLARRGTLHYGGLNLRLAKVAGQEIIFHTDPTNTAPRMAWAGLSGMFDDSPQSSGIVVLQHAANPDYPGDWVKFPEINWFQPTFPASGTRYELKKGEPLILRFRLWLHRGAKAGEECCAAHWRAYQSPLAPTAFSAR